MLSQLGLGRLAPILVGVVAGLGAATAQAQGINIDEGKTPPQIFASDCAVCHRAPRGLAKETNVRSLGDFLRQHYTSSREQAAAMAGFLLAAGSDPRGAAQRQPATTSRGQPPGAERASRTVEDVDATPESRSRRNRRGTPQPRTTEDGILVDEQAPRPPRAVPDRSRRQATTAPSAEGSESKPGSTTSRSRRAPAGEGAAVGSAAAAPAATVDAPAAAATSIDAVISRSAPVPSEPGAGRPVPPRKDDIPD